MKTNKLFRCGLLMIWIIPLLLSACSNQGSSSEGGQATTRIVSDLQGEVEIPANPLRIADISGATEELLILGIQPVATANTNPQDNNQIDPLIQEQLNKEAIPVGYYIEGRINLEALTSVQPDLILTNIRHESINEQVAKIAPAIVVKDNELSTDWRSRFTHIGEIFGREGDVKQWLQDYDSKASKLYADIAATMSGETFGIIETGPMGYRIYADAGVGDILFNDVKLPRAEGTPSGVWGLGIELEGVVTIDPDHIVLLYSEGIVDELEKSQVWHSLKAVQNGHVYKIPNEVQYAQAFSTAGKLKLLDTFRELIVDGQQ